MRIQPQGHQVTDSTDNSLHPARSLFRPLTTYIQTGRHKSACFRIQDIAAAYRGYVRFEKKKKDVVRLVYLVLNGGNRPSVSEPLDEWLEKRLEVDKLKLPLSSIEAGRRPKRMARGSN